MLEVCYARCIVQHVVSAMELQDTPIMGKKFGKFEFEVQWLDSGGRILKRLTQQQRPPQGNGSSILMHRSRPTKAYGIESVYNGTVMELRMRPRHAKLSAQEVAYLDASRDVGFSRLFTSLHFGREVGSHSGPAIQRTPRSTYSFSSSALIRSRGTGGSTTRFDRRCSLRLRFLQ